ncbi:MAG: TIGR04282 family arsenosugar biosynthesis glycosyltransferase [Anaerolineae bacterium]
MAKRPAVGRTKTRMCPPLEPAEAAALYGAMLRDTIEVAARLDCVQLALAVTPPEAAEEFRPISPPGALLLPVVGADIGDCLHQVLGHLLADGHPKAIAIDSDSPTLPADYLRQAVALLDEADVVLGPCEDGGYYLIGLKQSQPGLFRDIAWSTAQVIAQTLAQAEALGLTVALLPAWYDVDVAADLDRLRGELASLPDEALRHTRRFLMKQVGRAHTVTPGKKVECDEWVAHIETAATEVSGLLVGVPDDVWLDVAEGNWTAKDVVGHLAAWSDLLMDGVEALVQNRVDDVQVVDIDAWNADQIAVWRNWTVGQVWSAWNAALARALDLAGRLSPAEMSRQRPAPWTEGPISPSDVFDLWLLHVEQHRVGLVAWRTRNRLARDPAC